MSFRFSYVCDLLEDISENKPDQPHYKPSDYLIEKWFQLHEARIRREDFDVAALLSILLPEKRTDRVYGLQEGKLRGIFGRAQGLGRPRLEELDQWNRPGSNRDFADCVASVLKASPPPLDTTVTIKEVDDSLNAVASGYRFSSPAIRARAPANCDPHVHFGTLYKRLSPRDAKWFTRLILKKYQPVFLDSHVVYRCCHPVLPLILRVQDNLVAAGETMRRHSHLAGVIDGPLDKNNLGKFLTPILGVKVGRQTWLKGRSIKNCLELGHGRMGCEEKLDGEYCQIHIDLSKDQDCIQIFSKSGKDSTQDRQGLHKAIRRSLQIGGATCPVRKGCILEGELVVYSDKHKKILGFDKIRKHVSRSGSFLGTDADSQRHHWEHLMIVYYDVLMIDEESLLNVSRSKRYQRLERLVKCIPGRSALVRRQIINFDRPSAASDLQRALEKCAADRGEGLVLKADDPYFNFSSSRRRYECCPIKLKKQYLQGIGDVGDFAVVGARYDPSKAKLYDIPHLKYTHFYIACLLNKGDALQWDQPPQYKVTNVVELNKTQMKELVLYLNPETVLVSDAKDIGFEVSNGIDNGKRPSIVFREPPIFDIRSFSFEKPPNVGFWCPRFPGVSKIHLDRTWRDALAFGELEELAKEETEARSQENGIEPFKSAMAVEIQQLVQCSLEISQETRVTTPTRSSEPSQPEPSGSTPSVDGSPIVPESAPARISPPVTRRQATALVIPPRSSATDISREVGSSRSGLAGCRKRPLSSQHASPKRAKAPKLASDQRLPIQSHNEGHSQARQSRKRGALVDLTGSFHSQSNHMSFIAPEFPVLDLAAASQENSGCPSVSEQQLQPPPQLSFACSIASFSPRSEESQSTRHRSKRAGPSSRAVSRSPRKKSSGVCPNFCRLSSCQFLLAPCVSSIPWLTEDLLAHHGVTEYVSDPKAWDIELSTLASEMSTASTTQHQRITRKVVLVEPRRKQATDAFLREIEDAGLKRSNGKKEYVVVFDWRVMEALTKEEELCRKTGKFKQEMFDMSNTNSIWRNHWVGLV